MNAWILPEARFRISEMQLALRRKGCSAGATTPGKLVEVLILSDKALELLEEKFLLA